MNLHKKPTIDSFKLRSIKSVSREVLEVDAETLVGDGQETFTIPYKGTYPITPHPTLFEHLDKLKIRLANYYGYTVFKATIEKQEFKATKNQKAIGDKLHEEILKQIKVTGISISGKDRNAVVIKGTYSGSSINTKPLYFINEEYGAELELITDEIIEEVYKFLFEGKKAQLEIEEFGEMV